MNWLYLSCVVWLLTVTVCWSLKKEPLIVDGGRKREVDTAQLFQYVCAQASALACTKGPLYFTGIHSHIHSSYVSWLSKFDGIYSSLMSSLFQSFCTVLIFFFPSLCFSVVFSFSSWIIHVGPWCQMACALLILMYSFHSGHAWRGVCLRGV